MIEVFVESIRVNMANYKRVVMLKEKNEGRFLPIWIGHFEADAIAMPLQNVQAPRPLTHDLLQSVIGALDARVESVVISDLADETFFAKLVLDVQGRHLEIDARASDAIALAVRAGVPIYVAESVLDQAGMKLDSELEEEEGAEGERSAEGRGEPGPGPDDERLSVFRQFIETLDIDDLGKGGKEGPSRD
ncbi:MAG TPA: bifunctional nuclease family protein [Chloroflexota bacterium]|nr:bifunctional nuclease family protein [Chloroflexota bacterium]